MGDFTFWLALMAGVVIGVVLAILWVRSTWTPPSALKQIQHKYHQAAQDIAVATEKLTQAKEQHLSLENTVAQLQSNQTNTQTAMQTLHQDLSRAEAHLQAIQTRLQDSTEQIIQKNQQIESLRSTVLELRSDNATFKAENRSLQENQSRQELQIKELNQKAHLEFEKIASEILKDRTQRFTEANKTNLDALLGPLSENITGFKKIIQDTHVQDTKDRTTLETKISELIKQTNQVSEQANNLASALKGQVKKQGNWGEMILESILEQSGLVRDRQYFLQATLKDASGKQLRPDVLIKLPGSRTIIVDSKVSLLAYDRYVAATTKEEQQMAIKDHLQSMYQHIDQLHGKNYDQLEESLDFTMLFVPIEPAYLLGIYEDPALWANAYSKRILLISPTNLIACLKLMDDLWKREMQSRNAMDIVKQGERIYEKLIGFTQSLEAVGGHLHKAQASYQTAIGQMMTGRGNLIDQAVKLKSMGLKSSKTFSKELMNGALEENELDNEENILNEDSDPSDKKKPKIENNIKDKSSVPLSPSQSPTPDAISTS